MLVRNFPTDDQLFDLGARYAEWVNSKGSPTVGLRHPITKKQHGIQRVITPEGSINMCSYKKNKFHGLNITISADKTIVSLFSDGEKQSNFSFDANFQELSGRYRR